MNEAARYYKDHHCNKETANYNETYVLSPILDKELKASEIEWRKWVIHYTIYNRTFVAQCYAQIQTESVITAVKVEYMLVHGPEHYHAKVKVKYIM